MILPPGLVIRGLRDSKKTEEKDRKRIFWEIVQKARAVGVGIANAETIDRINILESTRSAMTAAVSDLGVTPDILLIDAVVLPACPVSQKAIIRGESVSASIAAASIVAKVVRDEIMLEYDGKYPLYNFRKHKGYSTREHMESIRRHGPCPIHRKSFRRVREGTLYP